MQRFKLQDQNITKFITRKPSDAVNEEFVLKSAILPHPSLACKYIEALILLILDIVLNASEMLVIHYLVSCAISNDITICFFMLSTRWCSSLASTQISAKVV